ncbi:MAG: hypothetical protein ACW972_03560 [Promethearchaeota archaeon]|jgi:hypothetical protein
MSLGDKTICGLSYNQATIDREALIQVLSYQYNSLLHQIRITCNDAKISIWDKASNPVFSFVVTENRTVNQLLDQLGKVAELLHTIKESKTRENTTWIDKQY